MVDIFAITTVLSMQIIVFRNARHIFDIIIYADHSFDTQYVAFTFIFCNSSKVCKLSRNLKFALFPLAMVWNFFVLRTIRLIGYLTHKQTGWGTREKVEL